MSNNPFLPSPSPSFLINHTTADYNDIFLLHQHNIPLLTTTPNFSLPTATEAPPPPFAANAIMINNNNNNTINMNMNMNMNMGATNYKKKPTTTTTLKKDRHSKIRTAQGMRDRRVRLSIGIARKFFDLQDTLGFDKASKTLEWLLTKSKTSITELTNTNRGTDGGGGGGPNKSSTSTSEECEVLSRANDEVADISGASKTTNKLPTKPALHNNLSKELREKARERARARTRAKLCITKANTLFGISDKSLAQVEALPSSRHTLTNRASRSDINTGESILIKRKLQLRPHPPNFAYDQNFVTTTTTTKDVVSNNNLPSLPQSWDISSSITRSSFYAMINSNLSTEFQVYGKPWEAHNNNQSLH